MTGYNLTKVPMPLLRPGRTDRKSPLSYLRMDNEQARFEEFDREFAILGLVDTDDVGFRSVYVMSPKHWYMVEAFTSLDAAIRMTRTLGDPTGENHLVHFKHEIRAVHLTEDMARLIGVSAVDQSYLHAYRVPKGSLFETGGDYTMNAWADSKLEFTAEDVRLNAERGRANGLALRERIVQNDGMDWKR